MYNPINYEKMSYNFIKISLFMIISNINSKYNSKISSYRW